MNLEALKASLDETAEKMEEGLAQYRHETGEAEYRRILEHISEKLLKQAPTPFSEEQLLALQSSIDGISEQVFKSFLPRIKEDYEPCELTEDSSKISVWLRILKLGRWMTNPLEQDIDKLKNTYNVLSASKCRFALIFNRTVKACEVYMAVYSTSGVDDPTVANALKNRFRQALQGNFPGVTIDKTVRDISQTGIKMKNAVAVVTNIASEKSEKFVSQGIEKLIDAYTPEKSSDEYTLVLLCEPLSSGDILEQKEIASRYYTALSPFVTWQSSANSAETVSRMEGVASGFGAGVNLNLGIPHVLSGGVSLNGNLQRQSGVTDSFTGGTGFSLSYTNHQVKVLLDRLDAQMKKLEKCEALGMWRFAAYVLSDECSVAENIAQMYCSLTQGDSSYIEQTSINVWNHAQGEDNDDKGENGEVEEDKSKTDISRLLEHLQVLAHPCFTRRAGDRDEPPVYATAFISGVEVAQALNMPRKSIPGLPVYKCAEFARNVMSVARLPDRAGLNNDADEELVDIGCIVYMRGDEPTRVLLNPKSLTAHTFITGSTGSGKSNTIYTLLEKLCLSADRGNKEHFLVIEPAKGEYKDVLGGYERVTVYGTNRAKTPLLRLNPFSFPNDIHVLEHIDRLIEIFNACWPMYAAMPAVLKAAVERAYANTGWSLSDSTNPVRRFPTFQDVIKALPEVIDSKGFSQDTQGDYKGALLTRLESLTNGINGQVLCAYDELQDEELFDRNVIVDLSRVGSMETKALLMGVLVLKLQEHRMEQRSVGENYPNNGLSHITVLEEAHHLLRRTTSEQTHESSNLQGKAVEMLTNAIAELRSFGEGFIIADQSPGLLDMAVIRNTNTKIIMRLPDEGDRRLVGMAAGLNNDQIAELSKLETGVAAIYQNEWMEPVLCKVEEFCDSEEEGAEETVRRVRPYNHEATAEGKSLQEAYLQSLLTPVNETGWFPTDEVDKISRWIDLLDTGAEAKEILYRGITEALSEQEKGYALYCAVKGKILLARAQTERNKNVITAMLDAAIIDALAVNRAIAEKIRRLICIYAAEQVREDVVYYRDILGYGGVM